MTTRRLRFTAFLLGLAIAAEPLAAQTAKRLRFLVAPIVPSTTCGGGTVDTAAGVALCGPTNTGIVGAGITEGSLVNNSGGTYNAANNGQTITGRRFTGEVTITGTTNITFDGNLWDLTASDGSRGVQIISHTGTLTFTNNTFRVQGTPNASGANGCVYQMFRNQTTIGGASHITFEHNDLSEATDLWSMEGGEGHVVRYNYIHDACFNSTNPDPHTDTFELYGSRNVTISHNVIIHRGNGTLGTAENGVIYAAPWSGSAFVDDTTVTDNYLDGAQFTVWVDNQASGITKTRILRNNFGGHTGTCYNDYADSDGNHTIVQTEAALLANTVGVLWPSSGADVNRYLYTQGTSVATPSLLKTPRYGDYSNCSPNRDGEIVPPN